MGVLLVALVRGAWMARRLLAPLPEEADRLLVEARIESIPAFTAAGWRCDASVGFARHPDWPVRRVHLQLPVDAVGPAVGERWQYAARLTQPRDRAGRRALLRDHASGYARVTDGALSRRLVTAGPGLDPLRERLARRIADRVADPAAAALLAALAVGATGEVSARQWQVFNATGITHLVAISGTHVTFFALLCMALARRLWRLLAGRLSLSLSLPLPRREAFAAGVGIVFALLYALLSGFSVPAQRTVVMLAAFLAARCVARRTGATWSLAVALAAVLLFDPLAVLGAGFWLSFTAVAALVLFAGARLRPAPSLRAAAGLQWLVGIALLPVTVAIFGSFAATGWFANALAIPVFTLLLVPPVLIATACHLLGAGFCADLLVQLAGWVAATLWPLLCWCADLPGALWYAAPPWSACLIAISATVLALLPLGLRVRALALVLVGSMFLLRAPRPAPGAMWIDSQGQGAATTVLLRTHQHLLLWGTGEVYGSEGARFARTLLPRLRATGYAALDLWLPGHLDRDTQPALTAAAAAFAVRAVALPPARGVPPEMRTCDAATWQWDGVVFELHATQAGRACELTATRGASRFTLPAATQGSSVASNAQSPRLVLDAHGLAPRRAR